MKTYSQDLGKLVLYQKSLAIFELARRVASYITDDKDMIFMYRSGSKTDNYADNLVMNAYRLVPKIAEVETQNSKSSKLKLAKSLRYFIDRIYQDCVTLENTKIQGKDFVQLLRDELKHLRKIHKNYVKSLL
ncbi:MAG: hypothetical protein R3342_12185 [Lutibacter sp.]|uniref:hypothetical protein n=1 Tax=Lutibacter sp. TaxID=1925666 RepID=UPI00299DA1F5|nr:hypothetical protein [Lutibacter sp.]MDX1830292.1 hypothetical protein [Lutibacter sp.]